jgi:CHAD domain-containing protein
LRRLSVLTRALGKAGTAIWSKEARNDIRTLFRSAGTLRDIRIQQRLLGFWETRNGEAFGELQAYLRPVARKARRRFMQAAADVDLGRLLRVSPGLRLTLAVSDTVGLKAVLDRAIERVPRIIQKANRLREEDVHATRVTIKKLKYTLDIYHRIYTSTAESEANRKELARLQDLFGFWHDLEVEGECIGEFMEGSVGLSASRIAVYDALKTRVREEQQAVLGEHYVIPDGFV